MTWTPAAVGCLWAFLVPLAGAIAHGLGDEELGLALIVAGPVLGPLLYFFYRGLRALVLGVARALEWRKIGKK